ncbi:hypothetical protein, partial [Photobacterium kasasachensis]|uniref:hypothetical protein n=1 Tax=Photobacterium kasasachensis TaxID=2910240 RepID=UPI003D0FC33E
MRNIRTLLIFFGLGCLFGCGDIQIEEDCFEPVQFKAGELFSSDIIRVTPVWGNNSNEEYLKEHGVVGYLSASGSYEP